MYMLMFIPYRLCSGFRLCSDAALGDVTLFVSIIVTDLESSWVSGATSTDSTSVPSASSSVVSADSSLRGISSDQVEVALVRWSSNSGLGHMFFGISIVVLDAVLAQSAIDIADDSAVPHATSSEVTFDSGAKSLEGS